MQGHSISKLWPYSKAGVFIKVSSVIPCQFWRTILSPEQNSIIIHCFLLENILLLFAYEQVLLLEQRKGVKKDVVLLLAHTSSHLHHWVQGVIKETLQS